MPRTKETRRIKWHETCKCKCRLDASVINNKQHGNNDKCRCEGKELIDKGICGKGFILNTSNCECECGKSCNKGFIWNPSIYECECDKSCDIGEYLDYAILSVEKDYLIS